MTWDGVAPIHGLFALDNPTLGGGLKARRVREHKIAHDTVVSKIKTTEIGFGPAAHLLPVRDFWH